MSLFDSLRNLKSISLSIFTSLTLITGIFNSFCFVRVNTFPAYYVYGKAVRINAEKLNVRDESCKIVKAIGKNSILSAAGQVKDKNAKNGFYAGYITCEINHHPYYFLHVIIPNFNVPGLYVLQDFVSDAGLNPSVYDDKAEFLAISTIINARSENCKRETTFTSKQLKTIANDRTRPVVYCIIDSVSYMLVPVNLTTFTSKDSIPLYIVSNFILKL